MAKLRINGDSSGYVDLEAPNAASSSTLDLDQVPQKNAATKFDTVLQVGSSSTMTNAYGAASGYVFDIKANSGSQSYMSIGMPADTLGSAGLVMGVDTSAVRITSRDDKRQIFSTNNIDRMTIHSTTSGGGAVTTPYQPAFSIESSYVYSATATGEQVFNSSTVYYNQTNIRANIGSHWSSSTGRFTAPVAGSYSFTFNVDIKSQTSGYMLIRIRKNGSQMVGIYPDQTSPKERVTLNTVLTLATGDYIDVSWNNNYTTPVLSYASFSGFLIG